MKFLTIRWFKCRIIYDILFSICLFISCMIDNSICLIILSVLYSLKLNIFNLSIRTFRNTVSSSRTHFNICITRYILKHSVRHCCTCNICFLIIYCNLPFNLLSICNFTRFRNSIWIIYIYICTRSILHCSICLLVMRLNINCVSSFC